MSLRRRATVVVPVLVVLIMFCAAVFTGLAAQGAVSDHLRELYEADQADRSFDSPPTEEQWTAIVERDHARRDQVMAYVRDGALESGDDYFHAAMVLQHGEGSEDILIAHILATAAGFKGHERGRWLSAAALDRYLHRTGEPQRLGTQYVRDGQEGPWNQGAYVEWLPDSVREAFGVPPLAQQRQRTEAMNGS